MEPFFDFGLFEVLAVCCLLTAAGRRRLSAWFGRIRKKRP
jgi:hypothetical protein